MPDPFLLGQLLFQLLPIITAGGSVASDLLMRGIGDQLVEQIGRDGMARYDRLRDRLLDYGQYKRDLPPNHDLQKALYLSFLFATEVIYQVRLAALGRTIEKHWLSGLKHELLTSLPAPVQPLCLNEAEVPLLDRKLNELQAELARCPEITSSDLQARLPFGPSVDLVRSLAAETKKSLPIGNRLLNEILDTSPWYKDAGPTVQDIARQHLWEYSGKFFAEQIKTNARVSRILSVELLADTGITLEGVQADLAGVTNKLGEISDDLKALRAVVESDYQEQFQLVDPSFLEGQKTYALESLLNIPVGNWACVIQKKSLQRDATRLVTERALKSSRHIVFQIMRGEPGSGKTTALRQVGAMLAEQSCAVLEARGDSDLSKLRFFVKKLANKAKSRLFVLVDDVYRDDRSGIIEFLCDPLEPLPVTLIGTTRSYEDRTSEIKPDPTYIEMQEPVSLDELSGQELDDLRRMPEFRHFSDKKFRQLTASPKILPVMLALTGGKTFDTIVYESGRWLKEKYPKTCEAWGVITTFGRWNLPVPNSLLEAILGNPHFGYEVRKSPNREGSEGLIFPSSYPFKEGWFPGHQLIGQAAFDRVYSGRLEEYCEKAILQGRPGDSEDCIFLGRMFRYLCSPKFGDYKVARDLFRKHEETILRFADSSPETGVDWGAALLTMEHTDLARHYLIHARPATCPRAVTLSVLLDRIGESAKAIQAAEEWCRSHLNDTFVRGYYLRLVAARGSEGQVSDVLQATAQWLVKHQNDTQVRGSYLGLVKERGTNDQVTEALRVTQKWLAASEHQNDTQVRGSYLGLVKERGSDDEVTEALEATAEWLALPEHQSDANVRTVYLGLVGDRGSPVELTKAVDDTGKWLAASEHQNDTQVRGNYLGLVKERGSDDEVTEALEATAEWLALPEHQSDANVRTVYLGLVGDRGSPVELTKAVDDTGKWLAASEHQNDTQVRGSYLGLVKERGSDGEVTEALEATAEWLALPEHQSDANVRTVYLGLVGDRGSPVELTKAVDDTGKWLEESPYDQSGNIRATYLGFLERCCPETLDQAIQESIRWLKANPQARNGWEAMIALLARRDKVEEAAQVVKDAIDANPHSTNLMQHYLKACGKDIPRESALALIDGILECLPRDKRARLVCATWLSENTEHAKAQHLFDELLSKSRRWYQLNRRYGEHLSRQEKYPEAIEQFKLALTVHKGFSEAHEGFGHALAAIANVSQDSGDIPGAERCRRDAEYHFKSAIYWAEMNKDPVARFHSALGGFCLDLRRFDEALSEFELAIVEGADYFSNHWHKGKALVGLKRYPEALGALRKALELADKPLESPATEKIPYLIAECENALRSRASKSG